MLMDLSYTQSTSKYLARSQQSETEQLLYQLHQRGLLERERVAAQQVVRDTIWAPAIVNG